MKKYSLLLLLFIFLTLPVQAQITIQESVLSSRIGSTVPGISYDFALSNDFTALLAGNGENQTWDLTGFAISDTFAFEQEYMPASSSIPGNDLPEFADADFVVASQEELDGVMFTGYNHQTLQNGELRSLGTTVVGGDVDMDGMEDIFHTFLDPAELIDVFPIEFGNMWTDSTSTTFSTAPGTVITTEESSQEVDGWGTLITDFGTFNALRATTILTIYSFPGLPPTVNTFIDFVTEEGNSFVISIDETNEIFGAVLTLSDAGMVGTSNESLEEVPDAFQLSQNFPNPFNPSTRISYSIPESADVQLSVYTITGKEIVTLVSGMQPAGTHEVTFDASNFASGVYLYRLQTQNFSEVRLMNLIK